MANVQICDRCNKILKRAVSGMATIEIEESRVCLGFVTTNKKWKHLCNTCMNDFYDFLREGESEEIVEEATDA